jgi:MoxR-like ATPase
VLGQFSLSELRNDRFRRVTDGRLTSCEVGFIDEIWKASSAILNCLLRILNEGVYEQEGRWVKAPLRLCVAASNEWPSSENGGKELGAIFDRFLFRHTVTPIRSESGRERLLFDGFVGPKFSTSITAAEIDQAHAEAEAIPFSDNAKNSLRDILDSLAKEGIKPSDRRKRKAVSAARAAAWLDESKEVLPMHLECLAAVLWDDPTEQPVKCKEIVTRLANPERHKVQGLLAQAEDIISAVDTKNIGSATEADTKLTNILKTLQSLDQLNTSVYSAVSYLKTEMRAIRAAWTRYANLD